MQGYIETIRSFVGHQPLILNSATGALLNNQNQILLQKRADTVGWSFPGGYLEYGETFHQAVIREFKEDVGLSIKPIELLQLSDDFQYEYPNGDKVQPVNCFYLVKHTKARISTIKTEETSSWTYFDLDRPPKFFNDQHANMLRSLIRFMILGKES